MSDQPITCPFCGAVATLDVFPARNETGKGPETLWSAFVKCRNRCVEIGAIEATEDAARRVVLATWNRREPANALRGALLRLVEAKDEKDQHGDTARYHFIKQGAWENARRQLHDIPHGMSLVKENALKDPSYAPYCLRCQRVERMVRVEPMLWRCLICQSTHDERSTIGVRA